MESVFCGFETLKFKQMKKIEENLNELLEVFDGTGVPNNTWVKDKLEETLILVKNCSIPDVVGRSELLVCEYCNDDAKPTCCDNCLDGMVNAVQKAN